MGIFVLAVSCADFIVASPFASAANISQQFPTADTIDVSGSADYMMPLAPLIDGGDQVTYTVTSTTPTSPGLTLVEGGTAIGTTGTLPVNTYSISGTDSDSPGADNGTWSFSLTVTPDTLNQSSPTSGTTDVAGSDGFTTTLAATAINGPVSFATSTSGFEIVGTDELKSTATLSASAMPYSVAGTDTDADGDTGSWSFALTVTPDTIVQGSPSSGFTTEPTSATFSSTLTAASGFTGPVTFATATSGFIVVNDDELQTTGPLPARVTPYSVSGTDTDAYGDTGTWTYALTVGATGSKTTIIQSSPNNGTVANTSSGTFTAGPLLTEDNTGAVTFVTTKSNSALNVSSSGLISTTGPLAVGTYSVSGTDSDALGDTGTWSYTLTVTGVIATVTFDANGGVGTMAPESNSTPSPLTINVFTRSGYSFVDWNTQADGSGVKYANGAMFPFGQSMTLYAQWKSGKAPSHTVLFSANGGTGSMAREIDNTPTAISANAFTRSGYTFVDWNTAANGSGATFKAGVTYSFKKSVTLFAQWKKVPKAPQNVVIFSANGGVGTMAVEHDDRPTSLTPNRFKRTGYTFAGWNTAANGFGISYANGAVYSFASSTNLYAQWKKKPGPVLSVVIFSPNGGVGTMAVEHHAGPAGLTLNLFTRAGYTFVDWNTAANGLGTSYPNGGTYSFATSTNLYAQWVKSGVSTPPTTTDVDIASFGVKSSTLSSALESQIQTLAAQIMANKNTQIALTGYGDELTAAQAHNGTLLSSNAELGRERAEAVATYLEQRLGALGLKGWSISISGIGDVTSNSDEFETAKVVATLS
jgi:uncharacterized repeat protein (TIGR02543 family)